MGPHKSFLFTESSLVVKMKNTWSILLSHFILQDGNIIPSSVTKDLNIVKELRMRRSFVKLLGLVKSVTKVVTR